MAKAEGLEEAFLHVIFDGRSTEPGTAPDLLMRLEARMFEIGIGRLATGLGRSIALDRNGDYEKTHQAFDAFVMGTGKKIPVD